MIRYLVLFWMLLLAACSSTENNEEETDSIEVVSVTPALSEIGIETEFEVTVDYKLISSTRGEVFVGFNTNAASPDEFFFIDSQEIEQGEGSIVFTVLATPVDHDPNGRFSAYANIVQDPNTGTATILESDIFILSVRPPFEEPEFTSLSVPNYLDLRCYLEPTEYCVFF